MLSPGHCEHKFHLIILQSAGREESVPYSEHLVQMLTRPGSAAAGAVAPGEWGAFSWEEAGADSLRRLLADICDRERTCSFSSGGGGRGAAVSAHPWYSELAAPALALLLRP